MDDTKKECNYNLFRCPVCLQIPIIKIYSDQGNCYIDAICCGSKSINSSFKFFTISFASSNFFIPNL